MTEALNTKLMDTEPGGENTQYESINTFTKSHAKSQGQFSESNTDDSEQQLQQKNKERGENTAEDIRYEQSISEHGFGGETAGNSGEANQGPGYGRQEGFTEAGGRTRREQGYGGGSGVGA